MKTPLRDDLTTTRGARSDGGAKHGGRNLFAAMSSSADDAPEMLRFDS
jgi:hypothetical protein